MGGYEISPDDPECLAKQVFDPVSNKYRHYIKFATAGINAGHMYNPQAPNVMKHELKRVDNVMGRNRYEFRRVTEVSYNAYVKFLNTGIPNHFRIADRTRLG